MAPVIPGPTTSDNPTENVVFVRQDAAENEVLRLGPAKMEIMEDGRTTDNRIGVVRLTLPPGMPGPTQHWHQMHDEVFLVTKGTITFTSRDTKIVANVGDTLVVPPCSPHTFANESDAEAEMINTFTPAYYVNYFRLMAEMIGKIGAGKLTPAIGQRAMLQYATIQVGKDHDWNDPAANPGKDVKNFQ